MTDLELMHYGVKGMKWGVRKDDRKGTGKKRSAKKASKKEDYGIAPELAVLALCVADLAVTRAAQAGASAIRTKMCENERAKCQKDSKTGFLLKNREMTPKEDAVRVNPSVMNFKADTKNNCMLCTSAYDLRRRGFEVQAEKAASGFVSDKIKDWYPKAKVETVNATAKSLTELLVKQGDGARGNLMVSWKGTLSGHSVAYEVNNGKLSIIDSQIGKVYINPNAFLSQCNTIFEYARLDNVAFSPKNIKEVAR